MTGSAWSNYVFDTKALVGFTVGLTAGLAARSGTVRHLSSIIRARLKADFLAPRKMVIVVSSDVRMSAGKVASQCAHAATGCVLRNELKTSSREDLYAWLAQGQPKVVLRGRPDTPLTQLQNQAAKHGLVVSLIKDAGRTEVRQGTYTALGIGPGPASLIDKVTGHLKTY